MDNVENVVAAAGTDVETEKAFTEVIRIFREGQAKEALVLAEATLFDSELRADQAIEIAKIAAANKNADLMLLFGEAAHRVDPANAPIANTYSEFLCDERLPCQALLVLAETYARSADARVLLHLRRADAALENTKLSLAEKEVLGRALAQLFAAVENQAGEEGSAIADVGLALSGFEAENSLIRSRLLTALTLRVGALRAAGIVDLALSLEVNADADLNEVFSDNLGVTKTLQAYAVALERRGHTQHALSVLTRILSSPAAGPETYLRVAALEAKTGSGAMLVILEAGAERFPESLPLASEHLRVALEMGHLALAASSARRIHLERPDDPVPAINYVKVLTWNQRFSEALELAQGLLARHEPSVEIFLAAAHAARGANRNDLAVQYARKAVEFDPRNRDIVGLYAEIAIKHGYIEEMGDIITDFLADASNFDLTLSVIEVLIQLTGTRAREYVDGRHLEQLQALVTSNIVDLPETLIWQVLHIAEKFGLFDFAVQMLMAGLERSDVLTLTAAPYFVEYVAQLARLAATRISDAPSVKELAQELVLSGLCAAATNEEWRAEALFRIASALSPDNYAAKINSAYCDLARGDVERAWHAFEDVTRVYANHMSYVRWPNFEVRKPWPHSPLRLQKAFDTLKPHGAAWPLITVITPSFNQCAYIEDTILSILNQNYPNLQYIIIDGQSTDGAVDVIRRYEDRVSEIIIEPDEGQTDAINKGLVRARGEIITWINSDDILAPGALHMVAISWLRTKADLFYGHCFVHTEYHFALANLPATTQETFTIQHLGDLFKYWMKGFFFYQPEVFFTRRILDLAGGLLDKSLYYTMDYSFWLQCAQNHARVEKISWPFAFFRQHAEQKTSNLLACMLEQAKERDRFVRIEPSASRSIAIRTSLSKAFGGREPRIGVVTSRLEKIFSKDSVDDLEQSFAGSGLKIEFVSRASELTNPNLVIKLVHLQGDVEELTALRRAGFRGPTIGWFWDNHHHLFENFAVGEHLDILMPGHDFASAYLRNSSAVLASSMPLCVTQWSRAEGKRLFEIFEGSGRRDRLYGGFVRYTFAKKRNTLIEALIAERCDGVTFLQETNLKRYFGLSPEERFEDWMSHKTSICLPLAGDLSQRLFDALLTGQVPIVPTDVHDLDKIIAPELQQSLPIIRFDNYNVKDVFAAHRKALVAFNDGGSDGVRRRHLFALEGHTFPRRIADIVARAKDLANTL